MKELTKGNMKIRCNKEYKSISPHSVGYINVKNTKNVNEEAYFSTPTVVLIKFHLIL